MPPEMVTKFLFRLKTKNIVWAVVKFIKKANVNEEKTISEENNLEISTKQTSLVDENKNTQREKNSGTDKTSVELETDTSTEENNVDDLTYYSNVRSSTRISKPPKQYSNLVIYSAMIPHIPHSYN